MKHYVKLFSVLSTGALLGCAQFSAAPTLSELVPPRVQPVNRISSSVSEAEGLFIRGRAAHGAGQLALAQERYAQVLVKMPAHLGALNAMAVIYAQTERSDEALDLFRQALALDPQAAHLHNNLGYALMRSGQLVEAERELAWAHKLNPLSSQTRENREILSQMKASEVALADTQLVAIEPHVFELRDHPQVLHGLRIEVSNGVGIRYLARRTAERLAPMGVVTARLTNQPSYQQSKTEIQFGAGQKEAADTLATKLPVTVSAVPSVGLQKNIQLRLVLGHDLMGKALAAWLESSQAIDMALAGHEGWRYV